MEVVKVERDVEKIIKKLELEEIAAIVRTELYTVYFSDGSYVEFEYDDEIEKLIRVTYVTENGLRSKNVKMGTEEWKVFEEFFYSHLVR